MGVMTPAQSDEFARIIPVASRCDVYGAGFVDLGNGFCGQIAGRQGGGSHVRIDQTPQTAGAGGWTTGGTSNAALRSDGAGMLPGASDAQHLRIQSGADPYRR